MPTSRSWWTKLEIMPPGTWCRYWEWLYSTGLPMGSPSRLATNVKWSSTGFSASVSTSGVCPRARTFRAMLKIEGWAEPLARGGTPVWMVVMPRRMASR